MCPHPGVPGLSGGWQEGESSFLSQPDPGMCPRQRCSNTRLFLRRWEGRRGQELECREGHATEPLQGLEPRRGEAAAFPEQEQKARSEKKSRGHSRGHRAPPGPSRGVAKGQ